MRIFNFSISSIISIAFFLSCMMTSGNNTSMMGANTNNSNSNNANSIIASMLQNGQQVTDVNSATIPIGYVNQLKLPSNSGGLMGIIDSPNTNLSFNAKSMTASILPNINSNILGYSVNYNGKDYYNPILKVQAGANFQSTLTNQLSEATILHWHGLILDSKNDGLPWQAIATNGTYSYNFTVANRSGTYWYHPHPDGKTARQAYMGLAGFYIVEDADSINLNNSLDLSLGTTDIPLVIQDKRLDSAGNLLYNPNVMDSMMGYYGDTILVNLTTKPLLNLSNRIYRFRLLNGSNARIYRFAFMKNISDKMSFNIIGTDGGLLDKPYSVNEVFIAPGERVDVLLDLTSLTVNDSFYLKSLAFDFMDNEIAAMGSGMMSNNSLNTGMMGALAMSGMKSGKNGHGIMGFGRKKADNNNGMMATAGMMNSANTSSMMQSSSLAIGTEFYVMKFVVTDKVTYSKQIPSTLSNIANTDVSSAAIRKISISGMQWLINNKIYNMNEFPIEVARNSTEIWEISNPIPSMPHPMHLHGFQFQVLQRTNSPTQIKNLSTDSNDRLITDRGWKDTLLIWPGETVRIAINFTQSFTGNQDYVYHCHNLEHEDKGMMINYRVK